VLADYQRQYPEHARELGDQVDLHQALEADGVGEAVTDTQQAKLAEDPTLGFGQRRASRLPAVGPDYEILAEIGRGGMGVVYRARQVSLNRLVALKMVRAADGGNAELLARFRGEAEVVSKLHHPQIVEIYDYGEHDGLPYLALELIEGGTLAGRLNGTPWPSQQAASLIAQLARAVHFAHDRGVIHRDLKPANVLVAVETRDRGQETGDTVPCSLPPVAFKIADFGLARVFRDQPSQQTQTGTLLGTPSYMAPEQAAGKSQELGPATDVYALGAILYELLAGRPPFRGQTPMDTLQQVLTSEVPCNCSLRGCRVTWRRFAPSA
jgi:serine/threonine protein kinase